MSDDLLVTWHRSNHPSSQSKQPRNPTPAALTPTDGEAEWGITVSQGPLGGSCTRGPLEGIHPVAKNNSQTDDRLIIGGDRTVHVRFCTLAQNAGPRVCTNYSSSVNKTLGRLTALAPAGIRDRMRALLSGACQVTDFTTCQ